MEKCKTSKLPKLVAQKRGDGGCPLYLGRWPNRHRHGREGGNSSSDNRGQSEAEEEKFI